MTECNLHYEIFPASQREIWPCLSPVSRLGFVLYGGTAIALQLGHRKSVDFDFFSSRTVETQELFDLLPFLHDCDIKKRRNNTLIAYTQEHVILSFFGGISFGRVGNPLCCPHTGIQLASLDDLMATKLKVLFDRSASKDYLDISMMIQAGISVAQGLSSAQEMFGQNFQPEIALKALTFFEDGDLDAVSTQDRSILIGAVKQVGILPKSRILSYELCSAENQEQSLHMGM